MIPMFNRTFIAFVMGLSSLHANSATETNPTVVVDRAELILFGKTFQAEVDLAITTPSWSRTLSLAVSMDRPGKSFLRVLAPAKDAGISSLRIETEMWNYIPAIERTIKIPPSLMLQPWLGSDFTNDDLVKESSLVNDYTHKMLETPDPQGSGKYVVEAKPKQNAPVVWGKVVYSMRPDFVPLKQEFFDERGQLIRSLIFSNVRKLDGRDVPTRWEMTPSDKPGKFTVITVKAVQYDRPIDSGIFSLRNLTKMD